MWNGSVTWIFKEHPNTFLNCDFINTVFSHLYPFAVFALSVDIFPSSYIAFHLEREGFHFPPSPIKKEKEKIKMAVTKKEKEKIKMAVTKKEKEKIKMAVTKKEKEKIKMAVTKKEKEKIKMAVTKKETRSKWP